MIVLDTNIVSEPGRPSPDELAMAWLNGQDETSLYLATPTIAELAMGANRTLLRSNSAKYSSRLNQLVAEYSGRLLEFDLNAAFAYGRIVALRESKGRPILVIDAMIAAICLVHDATLATRNSRDFDGLDLRLVNPFEARA